MAELSHADLTRHLLLAVDELEAGVSAYDGGRESAYLSIAVQLRKLIADESQSLLPRVVDKPTFHRLVDLPALTPPEPGLIPIVLSGRVQQIRTQASYKTRLDIDYDADPIPLSHWLSEWVLRPRQKLAATDPHSQPFVIPGFKIGDIIKETANKEGAHADGSRGPTISRMTGGIQDIFGGFHQQHATLVVAIGAYVGPRIRELLGDQPSRL